MEVAGELGNPENMKGSITLPLNVQELEFGGIAQQKPQEAGSTNRTASTKREESEQKKKVNEKRTYRNVD